MLILPAQPLRAEFTSFGLALMTAGLLAALVAWPLFGATPAMVFAVPALVAGGLAALHPQLLATPYDLWFRASRRYARYLRALLLRVGYRVVVGAAGRAGTSMQLGRPHAHDSLWRARPADGGSATPAGGRGRSWLAPYLDWAVHAHRPVAIALLPFVVLLRLIEEPAELDEPQGVAENVYTLF